MDKTGSDRSIPRSITRLQSSSSSHVRIPIRIEDCAHFHYDKAELASISVTLYSAPSSSSGPTASMPSTPTSLTSDSQYFHHGQRTPYCGITNETGEFFFTALVQSRAQSWLIRRTYTQLKNFDKMLHQCAWDRHVSRLEAPPSIMELSQIKKDVDEYKSFVHGYLGRLTALTGMGISSGGFSSSPGGPSSYYHQQTHHHGSGGNVACSLITCGPVLNFLEMDNRGNRLIPFCQDSEINTPAIAAVHVTRAREPAAKDELQLEVGDIISVIDMPPPKESVWWRGKRGLEVGYFPADCVQVISVSHTPRGVISGKQRPTTTTTTIPGTSSRGVGVMSLEEAQKRQPAVLKSRNKLSAVLRNFFANRPPRGLLRQAGLLQERVFGCDLAEHIDRLARANLISSSSHQGKVPVVVVACCEFVEFYCLHSDGVYRRSGVQSNIQKLRQEFDNVDNYYAPSGPYQTDTTASRRVDNNNAGDSSSNGDAVITIRAAPFLDREQYRTDIHCVPSVLKQYFRELPNPLLTHQLFHAFLRVTRLEAESERIELLRQTVGLLPPPHYQTLKYLMRHLHRLASEYAAQTSMNEKNLARVWGPNLLRKPEQGSLLDGTNSKTIPPPVETSEVVAAQNAAALMGSKGGGAGTTRLNSNNMGGISIIRGGGGPSLAETASIEMMTEVVQGAVIVELMIRQYNVVFEHQHADDDNVGHNQSGNTSDDAGQFLRSLSSIDVSASSGNDPAVSGGGGKAPFRISFRQRQHKQQQQQQSSSGGAVHSTRLNADSVSYTQLAVPAGTTSAKMSRRVLPATTSSNSAHAEQQTATTKLHNNEQRRNKTISMLQTEEFYPHFASGVRLIPLSDAAMSQQQARNNSSTLNITCNNAADSSGTVRPPSSAASSSFSRDFSDCETDIDDNNDVVVLRHHRRRNDDDDDDEIDELYNDEGEAKENADPATGEGAVLSDMHIINHRQRRRNGKSPERAPSSASRKSTGSQLAASVKKKLTWPFSRHNNTNKQKTDEVAGAVEDDAEYLQAKAMKPHAVPLNLPATATAVGSTGDCPLIDASPSSSSNHHSNSGVASTHHSLYCSPPHVTNNNAVSRHRSGFRGHERVASADNYYPSAPPPPPPPLPLILPTHAAGTISDDLTDDALHEDSASCAEEINNNDNAAGEFDSYADAESAAVGAQQRRRNVAAIASLFGQHNSKSSMNSGGSMRSASYIGRNKDSDHGRQNLSDSEAAVAEREYPPPPPPVYANLASLTNASTISSQQCAPDGLATGNRKFSSGSIRLANSSHNNNNNTNANATKRLSTFSSAASVNPSPLVSSTSSITTLTSRTLPTAGSLSSQQQPLYANTMMIDALKHRRQQQTQQQQELTEVVRVRPCSREFSQSGSLLTFDVVAAGSRRGGSVKGRANSLAAGSNIDSNDDAGDEFDDDDMAAGVDERSDMVGGMAAKFMPSATASSSSSWATQSLPARARNTRSARNV